MTRVIKWCLIIYLVKYSHDYNKFTWHNNLLFLKNIGSNNGNTKCGAEHVLLDLKQSTSALAGDPDPYPQVFQIPNAIPRYVQVSATRWLGATSQKLMGSQVLMVLK